MKKIINVIDIAENHLCCGCGICSYLCPDSIQMVDDLEMGRRPFLLDGRTISATMNEKLLKACPGISLCYKNNYKHPDNIIKELFPEWGPILEVSEGYAVDQKHRYAASSGGITSALAIYGIEKCGMHGSLHIAARSDVPYLNHTVLSINKEDVLSRMGSRYAPASPCDGLQKIVDAPSPCVMIGKPCDIAAIQKVRKSIPELDNKIGITISIFCAAAPSTKGTLALAKFLGIKNKNSICKVDYRGNGWPGNACFIFNSDEGEQVRQMSYADSWGKILCHYRQWRCNLCVDHTGEFADISVGDPWYRDVDLDDPGRSLVLARTPKGQEFLKGAVDNGLISIENVGPQTLPTSQPSLLNIRRSTWGRLIALRISGVATPQITGVPLFKLWLQLSVRQKVSSILGTIRRVIRYDLRKPQKVNPFYDVTTLNRVSGTQGNE